MAAVFNNGGLGNANLRLQPENQPPASAFPDASDIIVHLDEAPSGTHPVVDAKGDILHIEYDDGSIDISTDGAPLGNVNAPPQGPKDWFDNLAEDLDDNERHRIVDDLLRAIDQDLLSRKDWIEDRATGLKLLGFKIELPNVQGASDGAPVEGMSKVRHPLLAEAVLRFQANARAELLPTDGPVKIRNDDNDASLNEDELANAFERDMNHYLTAIATEYYPDTDRMLLMIGFGGTGFKKVYMCPLRNRPVSESVDADDLIVNQAATDLKNARRITHRTYLKPSTVKRLQILGVYRDVPLNDALPSQPDALQREEKNQQGLAPETLMRADERDREIYEVLCELDVAGFEHKHKGKASGLEIPYRVTIDVSSRTMLSLVRNYDEDDQEQATARKMFVKYPFVPGLGFYDIGLLHILGNTTNAVTAAWREMLDNGMYANFPGFLMSDAMGRQNTNIMRVPPGGAALIKTNGMAVRDAVMPLPYQTGQMMPLMSLVQNMVETGQRVGGTSELQVGEGRADAPVGTTLALIDQAVKVLNAVHKRLHSAQAEEFQMIVDVFKENPETFWRHKCRSHTAWDRERFLQAANNCELVPQADPNTASMGQRIMKITGLLQLSQATPGLYDPIAINTAALRAMGWANPQQFFVPKEAQSQPPPQLLEMQAKMKNEGIKAQADAMRAQADMLEAQAGQAESQEKIRVGHFVPKGDSPAAPESQGPDPTQPVDAIKAQAMLMDAETRRADLGMKAHDMRFQAERARMEDRNKTEDRNAKERTESLELAKDVLLHPPGKVEDRVVPEVKKIQKAVLPKLKHKVGKMPGEPK